MAEQHYEGGCHCGAVRFAVDVDLDQAIVCNCVRCLDGIDLNALHPTPFDGASR